jgi:putative oxidoreductase
MSDTAGLFVLAGRFLFGFFFAVGAGLGGHVRKGNMMMDYARQTKFPFPEIAGWPTGLWLIVGGLSIMLGVWPDVGALMIIAFLVPAAAYFHRFWELEDPMQKQTQELFFWRNVFGVGACLVFFGTFVTLGPELRFAITEALFDF